MPVIPQQPSSNGNGNRRGQVVDIGDRFGPGRNPSQPLESGDPRWHDPAGDVEGMPPNYGDFPLPHVYTFSGIFGSPSNVYRISDEALRHSYDNSRYMLNDPTLTECLEQRQRSLALLDWHLETDDPDDPLHKDVVERLTQLIKLTPRFMQYRENLHRAIWFGRSANTHRWRWKRVEGSMRLVLDRWNPVHGDKLVFRFDRNFGGYNPDQIGIRVGAAYKMGDKVTDRWKVEQVSHKMLPTDAGLAYFLEPGERHLIAIHKHLIEDGEWETPEYAGRVNGVGIRSKIYWTWYMKQECQAWLLEFLERSAFGVEIWTYPYGNEEARDQAKQAATERIGNGRNVVLFPKPPGEEGVYGYDRIEPAMAGAEVLKEIMHGYFGHVMKRYILGQTLTSEAAPTGLGSNLASVHLDTYLQIIRYDAVNLQETLTTDLVEPLKLLNSGTHGFPVCGDLPVRFVIDTESDDAQNKLDLYAKAFNMGVGLKESELMELIGAQMPSAEDTVLRVTDLNAAAQPQGTDAGGQPPMTNDEGAAAIANAMGLEPQTPDESGPIESYAKEFDEDLHPRDATGKFSSNGTVVERGKRTAPTAADAKESAEKAVVYETAAPTIYNMSVDIDGKRRKRAMRAVTWHGDWNGVTGPSHDLGRVFVDRENRLYARTGDTGKVHRLSTGDEARFKRDLVQNRLESLTKMHNEYFTKHDNLARSIADKLASLDIPVRIDHPQDSTSRYIFVKMPNGGEFSIRIADHPQPYEDGKPVGGWDTTAKRRHTPADISIDPHTQLTADDAVDAVRERLAGTGTGSIHYTKPLPVEKFARIETLQTLLRHGDDPDLRDELDRLYVSVGRNQ